MNDFELHVRDKENSNNVKERKKKRDIGRVELHSNVTDGFKLIDPDRNSL